MNTQRGLIKLLLIILVAVLLLSYFRVDLQGLMESEMTQRNFNYVWEQAESAWTNYIAEPAKYLWQDMIKGRAGTVFNNFIGGLADNLTK